MPVISVTPERLAGQLEHDYKAMLKRVVRAVQVEVHTSGLAIVDDEVARARPLPVDRGTYRRSWQVAEHPDGASLFNDSPYASIIENGRRPGSKMPPVDLIYKWVKRKHIGEMHGPRQATGKARFNGRGVEARTKKLQNQRLTERQQRGIAFVIARAIGKRGQKGHFILAKTREFLDVKVAKAIERAMLPGGGHE